MNLVVKWGFGGGACGNCGGWGSINVVISIFSSVFRTLVGAASVYY